MSGNLNSTYEDARIVQIFRPCGKWSDGVTKYVKAGCQIVYFGGNMYFEPVGYGTGTPPVDRIGGVYASAVESLWLQSAMGLGWIDLQHQIVMEDHEFGDFQSHPDDWKGLHRYAMI